MNAHNFFSTYSEVVIFDTEYTTWEGAMDRGWSGEHEHRELVQLAAAKVEVASGTVLETFDQLVVPRINTDLSTYFTELTGITQAQIEERGIDFAACLERFLVWSIGYPLCSYAFDTTMGDEQIFAENIALYTLDLQLAEDRFINIAPFFSELGINTKDYNSGKLHQYFEIPLEGQEHNALHDVTSLAVALAALQRQCA